MSNENKMTEAEYKGFLNSIDYTMDLHFSAVPSSITPTPPLTKAALEEVIRKFKQEFSESRKRSQIIEEESIRKYPLKDDFKVPSVTLDEFFEEENIK